MSDELIQNVLSELEVLDPICAVIDKCQSKETNIADGADLWLNLKIPIHLTNKEQCIFQNRIEMALGNVAVAAFYIDPFKNKNKLSAAQKSDARQFLSEKLHGNFKDELLLLEEMRNGVEEAEEESHDPKILLGQMKNCVSNAKEFWILASGILPNLSKIAFKLLKIPATTAQLERVFSMWNHIHNRLRNRLTFERSKKLMHIYYYFTQIDDSFYKEFWSNI